MVQIFIDGKEVEILEQSKVDVRLDKSIGDFRDPFARTGDKSYTISIPRTPKNNKIFDNIQNINTTDKFNRVNNYSCDLISDGNNMISGTFILSEITPSEFKGNITSTSISWASGMENKTLQDLKFDLIPFNGIDRGNAALGFPVPNLPNNVILTETWDENNQYFNKWWMGLMSYGNFYERNMDDRAAVFPSSMGLEDFTPQVSLLETFRQVFSDLGYKIQGDFISDDDVKRLMISGNGSEPILNWKHLLKFRANGANIGFANNNSGITGYDGSTPVRRHFLFSGAVSWDYASSFDTTSPYTNDGVGQEWICRKTGKYRFEIDIDHKPIITTTNSGHSIQGFNFLGSIIGVYKCEDGDTIDQDSNLAQALVDPARGGFPYLNIDDDNLIAWCRPFLGHMRNGWNNITQYPGENPYFGNDPKLYLGFNSNTTLIENTNTYQDTTEYITFGVGGSQNNGGYLAKTLISGNTYEWKSRFNRFDNIKLYFETELKKGDILKLVYMSRNELGNVFDAGQTTTFRSDVYTRRYEITYLGDGDEQLSLAKNLPKVKQSDFVKEIIKLFNLYFNVDEQSKIITFYKRKNFFKQNSNVDISKKVNLSEASFSKLDTYQSIDYGFVVDDNDDFKTFNEQELTKIINYNVYSNLKLVNTSVMFAPTYDRTYKFLTGSRTVSIPTASVNDSIFQLRQEVDWDFGVVPRLVFRGSYIQTVQPVIGNGQVLLSPAVYGFKNSFGFINYKIGSATGITTNIIPLSEFVNSVSGGLQLNFKDVGNTIYTSYHKDQFIDYSNSYIISVPARLSSVDYANIIPNYPLYINGELYYLNQIIGFDPINPLNTIIEVFKIA